VRGEIKFVDARTGQWGYLIPDDETDEVRFQLVDFSEPKPSREDAGKSVEFSLYVDPQGRRHARHARILEPSAGGSSFSPMQVPGKELLNWAYVPYTPFRAPNGADHDSALALLAGLALPEVWHFGESQDASNPYPILDNYLRYTFCRLRREGKVAESRDKGKALAAFNTGLVNDLYEPIYALFGANDRPPRPWRFHDFCVPGKARSGKLLTSSFEPLPQPAQYFSNDFDMLLDTTKEIHVDYPHVLVDGIKRDRFPSAFLRQHVPPGYSWTHYDSMDQEDKEEHLASLAQAVERDRQCLRSLQNRLGDAKRLAEKRTRWNYKTAVPQYHPRKNAMSFLLPLSLVRDEHVDIALVVTRNPVGSYQGRTVLPLDWAYKNARLVCRPDSDWLLPRRVGPLTARLPEHTGSEASASESTAHREFE